MKKTLIALAALASTAAFAQSVTLSGGVSTSFQKAVAATSGVARTDAFMKIAATEDLGGGLKVAADVSMDFGKRVGTEGATANAPATTNSNLSISSDSLGTLAYANVAAGSARLSGGESGPSDLNGLLGGDTMVSQVKYTLPTLAKGLTLSVDATAATVDGNAPLTYTIGYADGPVAVGYDYRDSDKRQRVNASYDAGVAKFALTTDIKADDENEFAVTVPMGAVTLGLHYVQEKLPNHASGTAVSANYALSKRTSILGSVFSTKSDVAANNGNSYRVRLLHTF